MADVYKEVLFNDGEGLVYSDLNDIQRFAAARLFNQVVIASFAAGNAATSLDPDIGSNLAAAISAPMVFALHGGAGFVIPGVGARTTTVRAGTIMTYDSTVTAGSDMAYKPYTLTDTEFTLTHDVGDANPRIDLIEIKIDETDGTLTARDFQDAVTLGVTSTLTAKRRQGVLTAQIKKGTAAATPTYPSPTAGYSVLGAVYVPALHNAVFTTDHIRDQRFPLGVKAIDVPLPWCTFGTSSWTIATSNHAIQGGGTANPFRLVIPGGQHTRVLGVGLMARMDTGATVATARLCRQTHSNTYLGAPTITELAELASNLCANTVAYRHVGVAEIAQRASSTQASTRNPTYTWLGDPVWCNGRRGGPAAQWLKNNAIPVATMDQLILEMNAQVGEIKGIRLILAGGF